MTISDWPDLGEALISELREHPGRVAFVTGANRSLVCDALATVLNEEPLSVGVSATSGELPPTPQELGTMLSGSSVITEIDVLFSPKLLVDPIRLLIKVARTRPGLIVEWPGEIVSGKATYSSPGRRDWYESPLEDAVVLRSRAQVFLDEAPFEIERLS